MAHSVGAAEERRSRIVASAHCRFLLRFLGRLDENAIHARRQEASEKRQGTKSREVWHPTVHFLSEFTTPQIRRGSPSHYNCLLLPPLPQITLPRSGYRRSDLVWHRADLQPACTRQVAPGG